LSLSRFLFMANEPAYFDPEVIAEMRGVVDDQGHSPFWDAVGHHFFDVDFPKADYLSMVNKRFIADLMPKHPIYIPLLPGEAQAVIGAVHEHTRPALRILEAEGFQGSDMVDIFEAGPVVRCLLKDVRAVRESVKAPVETVTSGAADGLTYLVSNCKEDFRATIGTVAAGEGVGVTIPADVSAALRVGVGDAIRYVPLKPSVKPAYHDSMMALD
jgi:arginine N-succinyltransferase